MIDSYNTVLYPGDEVKLKQGDFPVVITRKNVTAGKKHYDYAGERKDWDKDNYLLFGKKDIEKVLKRSQNQLKDYLRICFWDTLEKLEYPVLKELAYEAIESTKVYEEGFSSAEDKTASLNGFARINVLKMTAFDAVRYFQGTEKTAVINFANPLIPGGNVKEGGLSREECLCRSSCLYPCLCREDLQRAFYEENRVRNNWFSDKVLYTSSVTIFKNDSMIPQMTGWKNWILTDVISVATPFCPKDRYVSSTVIKNIFIPRIRNILEVAIDNEVTVLIAGAFGCGEDGFDSRIVASAYLYLLREERYITKFNHIIFAITSPRHEYSKELNIFSQTFSGDWFRKKDDILNAVVMPTVKKDLIYVLPTGKKLSGHMLDSFLYWRKENPLYGKKVSILGDSVSTLQSYNPDSNRVFYNQENRNRAGITSAMDTWWGILLDYFGSELLVNNAWSGCTVTKIPGRNEAFPSAYSKRRTNELHQMGVMPDVILVYVGTNDWARGIRVVRNQERQGLFSKIFGGKGGLEPDYTIFTDAYRKMLSRLRRNYPQAEIWCCTLTASYMSDNPEFRFPFSYGGENIETYNSCIRVISSEYGCRLIDFYRYGIFYDSIDGSHPNVYGMRALAYMAILSMADAQGKTFLKQ